jgi:copper chaperone
MNNQIRLLAKDISCQHCAMTIQRELEAVPGVAVLSVDVPTKTVTLAYDEEAALVRAEALLDEIGYPAERQA